MILALLLTLGLGVLIGRVTSQRSGPRIELERRALAAAKRVLFDLHASGQPSRATVAELESIAREAVRQ